MNNQVLPESEKAMLPFTHREWERRAREKLEIGPYSFISGNAGMGETANSNRAAIKEWKIVPRVFRDVEKRDLSIELLEKKFSTPILLAPIGVQKIMHPEGELASARAAADSRIPFIASTMSSYSMEEIASVMGDAPRWFQLYCSKDKEITKSFIKRAERSGYSAIVITLDSSVMGWRVQDLENNYSPFRLGIGLANYFSDSTFCSKLVKPPAEDFAAAFSIFSKINTSASLTWEDLEFLRENTKLPILLKGIVDPRDAKLALDHGVDGIIVSNHGGRQLDGSIAAIDALPKVCYVIGGKIPVLMDSGIRTGTDVIKALALGASAVLLGRPFAYGLAVAGEEGVKQVIRNLITETEVSLGLSGYHSIKSLDRSLVVK
ncbi:lactate 2-monooxygenase [Neobacillus niacini]|uniref:alpha-hydroxy-acid oxidizing protein n=1 Tax=Neobacillus niacini TaxID=86668 RepID=UPI002786426D|nr:alpha-hydroxy-acid oxidizing protein [Neobacillus niacini]MDQ1002903.1 lactate 2-monooxygenase [Neobacillus niacini]